MNHLDLVVDLCVWLFVLLGFGTLVESFVALCVSRASREVDVTAARTSTADADEDGSDGDDGDDDDDDGSSTSSKSSDNDNDDGHVPRRRAVEWTHDSLFSFYESLVTRNVPLTQKQKQRARLEGLLDDRNGETHWWRVIRSCDGGDGDGAKDGGDGDGDGASAAAVTQQHLTSLSPRTRRRLYDWGEVSMETLARLIVLDVFLLEHEPSLLAKERYLNDVFMPSLFKFKNVFVLHGHVQQLRRRRRRAAW